MNCPICFSIIENSCVPSCSHHFCYECLIKWVKNNGNNCPICKQFINEIKIDTEFDILQKIILQNIKNYNNILDNNLHTNNILNKLSNHKELIILPEDIGFTSIDTKYNDNDKIGITIKNNNGPGVKVISLKKDKLAYKHGVRVNNIILFINNIPCQNHQQSVDIINHLILSGKKIKLTLL